MYDYGCQQDLLWWSFQNIYKYQMIILYTWTNILFQLYFNLKEKKIKENKWGPNFLLIKPYTAIL